MRIEQLEYVAAVARLGSYRKAAESLHISQPALSESVRSLERELRVDLLERGRQGARLSGQGRDLMQHMLTVLDAVDRLRHAADEGHQTSRMVRIGTVNAATGPLLAPAIRQFRETHPATQVEVVGGLQADVQRGLMEGGIDLGLVNCLEGDDTPAELDTTPVLSGSAVVCLRPDSPLAARQEITVSDLRSATLIGMRSGYVMHRYLHRLLGEAAPKLSYSADGAEMGKLMVAEGLGITVLPAFSVIGDPLETRGAITWRPLADRQIGVQLVIQRLRSASPPRAVRDLHRIFVQRARTVGPVLGGAVPAREQNRVRGPGSEQKPGGHLPSKSTRIVGLGDMPISQKTHQPGEAWPGITTAAVVGNPKPASRTLAAATYVVSQLTGAEPDLVVDLATVGNAILDWSDQGVSGLVKQVGEAALVVFASPTYKAAYTGLLKLFLDRFASGNGLSGVAIPLMLGGSPAHSLAPELALRPVLAEIGGVIPCRGLYVVDSAYDDPAAYATWLAATKPAVTALLAART